MAVISVLPADSLSAEYPVLKYLYEHMFFMF